MKKLLDEQQIRMSVVKVASLLDTRYGRAARTNDRPAIFLGVLDGAFMFMADLIREFDQPVEVAFVHAKSYGSRTERVGESTNIVFPPELDVTDRDVLVVEDIIDTGYTMAAVKSHLQARGARSVEICVLLNKPAKRQDLDIEADYVAFTIEDEFVVGYGTDYAGQWRHLRDLWIPEEGEDSPRRGRLSGISYQLSAGGKPTVFSCRQPTADGHCKYLSWSFLRGPLRPSAVSSSERETGQVETARATERSKQPPDR